MYYIYAWIERDDVTLSTNKESVSSEFGANLRAAMLSQEGKFVNIVHNSELLVHYEPF